MFIFTNKIVQRAPWNKGKLTGQKPPLLPKHVWAIRTKLHLDGRIRDLALFNLAIDSKLRGCDLVSLRAGDVAPHSYAIDRAMVRQRKTSRPVKFEIAEHTRQAVDNYLSANPRTSDDFLFIGWKGRNSPLTTRQYARLVSQWVALTWMHHYLARIHYDGPRLPSSIGEPGTFEQFNCFLGILRLKAPSGIWALRWMMPWILQRKLTFEAEVGR